MFFEFPIQELQSKFSVTIHKDKGPTNANTGPSEATQKNTWKADDIVLI